MISTVILSMKREYITQMMPTMKFVIQQILAILPVVMLLPDNTVGTSVSCRTPGFIRSSDGRWCLHMSSTEQNFAAASVFCQAYNATLVTMETVEKQVQVEDFLNQFPGGSWREAYIGATRILSDNTWIWYQRGEMNHSNWDAEEPGSQQGYACAVMKSDYNWKTINCNQEQRYLCQKENISGGMEDNI